MVNQSVSDSNPYVMSLAYGLSLYGHEVVCSLDDFWNSFQRYDLLYFQWPEAIFGWKRAKIDIEELSRHFDRIKDVGIKMVVTCHNLHPHNHDAKTTELYELVYSRVDAFHHMGRYSFDLMKERYPCQYHFIAPHHIADCLWGNPACSLEAKRRLHIPENRIVISSFGAFRNDEEVRMCVDMAKDIANRHMIILAPRIPIGSFYNGRHIKRTMEYLYDSLLYKRLRIRYSGFLIEEEMRVWISASDILFIQRKDILNSGNLPMAFAAGKVVVGPERGNVGDILKETGNYVFDPYDRGSVKQAILDAIDEVKTSNQLGIRNYLYARENWSVSKVCGLIDKELSQVINRNSI